ncbi:MULTISPECIES: hypothetical protein [Mesorhizobium]|uniref:hypothetical protein n=1 Tax=Mesorhizobium TaxID=68287 RepID=UPI000AE5BCC7|nr:MULTISPECIES: hypothetical protein [Mesorhizobium]MDF3208384.1 hypothetical protein [Mesorhizobium sp. LMG15046]MDF3229045.1 hypothetical protein [Mesorhizobium sp. DSM 30133]
MSALRFCIGFAAGILDGFGTIRARDRILRLVRYDGATMNGFDRAADMFSYGH